MKRKSRKKVKRPKWRKAVRQAMLKAANNESRKKGVGRRRSFNYRWEHVKSVVSLAVKLAELVDADVEIVEAAAWLHDVAKTDGNGHARAGARFARNFLAETDFPPKKIAPVAQAIDQHVGLWLDEPLSDLEAMVLWDADKLTKLGMTAAVHFTGFFMARTKSLTTLDLIQRAKDVDWQKKTVKSMHTKPARKAAKSRLKRYRKFWDSLESEIDGDDLG